MAPPTPPPPPPPPPAGQVQAVTARATMAGPKWRWTARGAWWRIVTPIGSVVVGLALMLALIAVLHATNMGSYARGAIAVAVGSAAILGVGVILLLIVQPAQRRLMLACRGRLVSSLAIGLGIGAGMVVGSAIVIATGAALDDNARRTLEEAQPELAGIWWQSAIMVVALVVLAPVGEEILFRATELRGLVRLVPFAIAAPISGVIFTAAHLDAWIAWPRALALIGTGWGLAWLYRWRGWPASVAAHATVNVVAAIALVAQA